MGSHLTDNKTVWTKGDQLIMENDFWWGLNRTVVDGKSLLLTIVLLRAMLKTLSSTLFKAVIGTKLDSSECSCTYMWVYYMRLIAQLDWHHKYIQHHIWWAFHYVVHVSGSNMFSGGEEGVLVLWQYKTDHQVFLPRLSTPINHLAISPDDSLTAVSQRENGMLSVIYGQQVSSMIKMILILLNII